MKKMHFSVEINSTAEKIWEVLWNDESYRKWTKPFEDTSFYKGKIAKGERIHFLTARGEGMYSDIISYEALKHVAFKHVGEIKDFIELPLDEKSSQWTGGIEEYFLKDKNNTIFLEVNTDSVEEYFDFMNEAFPKALAIVKELAEQPK